jgi:hypothetical protein
MDGLVPGVPVRGLRIEIISGFLMNFPFPGLANQKIVLGCRNSICRRCARLSRLI